MASAAGGLLASLALAGFLQPAPPAPGFSIAFDGGVFTSRTVAFAPMKATYTNNYWHSTRDPRIDRLSLDSEPTDGLRLHFDALPKVGVTSFDRKDEDSPARNPYVNFEVHAEDWPAANGFRLDLQHVDVTIAKLDPPGGRIEGTFKGTYELCTLPEGGGGTCTARAPLGITGTFSVVRGKDRVVE